MRDGSIRKPRIARCTTNGCQRTFNGNNVTKNNVLNALNYHLRQHKLCRLGGVKKRVPNDRTDFSESTLANIAASKKAYRQSDKGKLQNLQSIQRLKMKNSLQLDAALVQFNSGILHLPSITPLFGSRTLKVDQLSLCRVFLMLRMCSFANEDLKLIGDLDTAQGFVNIANEMTTLFCGNMFKYDVRKDTWGIFWEGHRHTFIQKNGWHPITLSSEERITAVQVS